MSTPNSHSPLYRIWAGIAGRCRSNHPRYGGRGIALHSDWDFFKSFEQYVLKHLGPRPSNKHSIDRIDNDGNYEPGNIKWSTQLEQSNNTSRNVLVQYKGDTYTIAQLARVINMRDTLLRSRLARGVPVEVAVVPTCKDDCILISRGISRPLAWWADKHKLRYHVLYQRVFRYNWPIPKALTKPVSRRMYEGKVCNIAELAKEHGLRRTTVQMRLHAGWTLGKALRTPTPTGIEGRKSK